MHKLKVLVAIKEALFMTILAAVVKNAWVLLALVHDVSPLDVNTLEALGLSRQLLHNIG